MTDVYQADDLLTRFDEIRAIRKKASREPTRFRDYNYLAKIFDCYAQIRSKGLKDLAVTVISGDLNIKINRDAHLFRAIIDATCKADPKTKSRWTRALRYAWKQRNHWERLPRFFRRNGGISGCANWFTESRRWRRPKANRIKLPSDTQIRLMKKHNEAARARLARRIKSKNVARPIVVRPRLTFDGLDRMAVKNPDR
jgi:hypothetical protein